MALPRHRTPAQRRDTLRRSDAGLLVVGTGIKLLALLAVIGVTGYDGISMVATHMTAKDDADQAALAGNTVLDHRGTAQAAYDAVVSFAHDHGDVVIPAGFAIGPNNAVTVELRRVAHTIAAAHLPRIKDYTVVVVTSTVSDGDF